MVIAAFFHAYAAGDWEQPTEDYIEALLRSDFMGPIHLGLIGPPEARKAVLSRFERLGSIRVVAEAETGAEALTLSEVRKYAKGGHTRGAVLYAHTKGAANPTHFNIKWRESMLRHTVEQWKLGEEALRAGADAVGCHWLHPGEFPHLAHSETLAKAPHGFFGGNFWLARCNYLKTLPKVSEADRWEAEAWIGQKRPVVYDLLEGWPSLEVFEKGEGR